MNFFFSKRYKVKCPDGTTKIIFKDIDKAFPLAVKDLQTKIDTAVKAQKTASLRLTAQHASKIQGLLYSIDEQNQSLMINFRFAYIAFQSDPCNDRGFLQRQSEQVQLAQQRLLELKTHIGGLIELAVSFPNNSDKILTIYQEIVSKLGGENIKTGAAIAIEENTEAAKKWIGGGHE